MKTTSEMQLVPIEKLVPLNRICCGIELEPKFVDVAVKRYIEFKNGDTSDVYVVRDGKDVPYAELEVDDE